MSDLKPCPFCGGEPEFERIGTPRQSCIVVCDNCGVRHESCDEGEDSGASWNRRAQPAQAGQVLTDEELLAMWAGGDERFMRPVLGSKKVLAFARAVLARVARVPMTEAQIEAALWGPQPAEVWCRDFRAGVRAAERHHGIVGEKGGQ